MKINRSKLKHQHRKNDGSLVAQCPACAVGGGDSRGEHLIVYPDNKFGCIAFQGDHEHNQQILRLIGEPEVSDSISFTVERLELSESKVLLKVGRLGRENPSPNGNGGEESG